MSDEPIKWRYGARLRSGEWIWPRGHYEYDLDKAKAAALRTFPFADVVGVEPGSVEPDVNRWVHERNKGWRLDDPAVEAAAKRSREILRRAELPPEAAHELPKPWWDRD